jgi:hypothetical protein
MPDDMGPKVDIVCWLLVALSAVFVGLRVFCKFKTHRALWWDDHILIVSWVCALPPMHERLADFSTRYLWPSPWL